MTNGTPAATAWEVAVCQGLSDVTHCLALVRNENGRGQLNLCVYEGFRAADVEVEAACQGDEGVGVVWRCQDAANYYVCRVNPMEGNFNLYKVVDGTRTRLASARLERFIDEQWYRIRVVARGDEVVCYLDDRALLRAADGSLRLAGRCGVWTRADALGRFAAFRARLPEAA